MIVHKFLLLISLCVFCTSSIAADVRPGVDTYEKTERRLTRVTDGLAFESSSWIFRSKFNGHLDRRHYNGHRDSVLLVPTSSHPDDLTLIVWFHGLGGFSEKTFRRVLSQAQEISKEGYSIAIAIPEMPWSINTSTKRSRQGRVWRRSGDFSNFILENKTLLASWAIANYGVSINAIRIVVVGHSAGGSAISSAAVEGGLCDVQPHAIVWSDARYGRWLGAAWSGCLSESGITMHLLVRKWDKPHRNAEMFMKTLKGISPCVKYQVLNRRRWRHGDIGNRALILSDLFPPGC